MVHVTLNKVYSDSSYGWLQTTRLINVVVGREYCNPESADSVTVALRTLTGNPNAMAPGGWR